MTLMFGVVSPNSAQAAEVSGWPLHFVQNMLPDGVTAFGNDDLSFTNCSNSQQAESFQYVHDGLTVSSLPTSQVGTASPPHEGIACNGHGLATADGTFYTTYVKEDGSGANALKFAAMKNGRALWSTDLSSDPACSTMSSWGSESQDANMTNASIGSDGNIYGVVQAAAYGCATYIAGVSSVDGHVLFKHQLTTNGSGKSNRLWVYNDKILTVNADGLLQQFSYDGTENTSASYQFPSSLGMFGNAYANADGRVFATGMCSGSVTDTFLAYHDPNGDNNVAASGLGCNPSVYYTPGANGSLVAYGYYGAVTKFSFSTTSISSTTTTAPVPSGVSNAFVYNYWQDSSGNAVMLRQLYGPSWSSVGVSVDEIDGSTGAVTNLFLMGVDSTHPHPSLRVADVSPDGYLYPVICNDVYACPNTASTSVDDWVHKIPLTGLVSAPIKDTGQFATYTSTKRKLVALGDSYSSGEGALSYLPNSDIDTIDTCHRSQVAYPELLEENTSLNLDMTAFVACSGATEDKILGSNVANSELPQGDALAAGDANIVTMSIGGNNANFAGVMSTCTLKNAMTDAQTAAHMQQTDVDQADCAQALSNAASTLTASSFTSNLTSLYNQVESLVPDAKLLIVEYPQLFPDFSDISGSCTWGTGSSLLGTGTPSGRVVSQTEVTALRSLTNQLDGDIATAVANTNNSNIMPVDPRPEFAADALCTSTPWFNGPVFNFDQAYIAGSYHPNAAGQAAYATTVAAQIATLTFP